MLLEIVLFPHRYLPLLSPVPFPLNSLLWARQPDKDIGIESFKDTDSLSIGVGRFDTWMCVCWLLDAQCCSRLERIQGVSIIWGSTGNKVEKTPVG